MTGWFYTTDDKGNRVFIQWSQVKMIRVTDSVVTITLEQNTNLHFHGVAYSSLVALLQKEGLWK